jgi:N-acetylmuramoyl-L-alanine amidase
MFAVMMRIVLRVLRGAAVSLALLGLLGLLQPQAGNARVKQPRTTSAHAALHPVPPHYRANARKTERTTVAHAHSAKLTKHAATALVRPGNNLANRPLIVIDPGHGGRDPGAIGITGTPEKTITLAAAQELRRQLEATGRYRVVLTRTKDRTLSLAQRLVFARSHDADLMIAIHADASHNHRARGASVYVSSGSTPTTQLSANRSNSSRIARALTARQPQPEPGSAWLQYSMIEQLADDVRMVATPARAAHLYVLGSRTMPSVLLEMGFLSNRRDEALLSQPAHRRVLVQAIRDAIDDYFAAIRAPASRT